MNDLTKDKPFKTLLLFALPMVLSVTLQQFYNICDSAIAGKFVSSEALASISSTYPITMIYLAIGTGFGVGANIVTSNLIGQKCEQLAKKSIYTSIMTNFIIGFVLTTLGLLFINQIVSLINVEEKLRSDAIIYLQFYTGGLIFLFLYNIVASLFQSLGNSKIPLYFLIFSTLLNISLDLLFVIKFKQGVKGLAVATFLSQMIASLLSFLCLIIYCKKIKSKEGLVDFRLLKKILPIAIPSIIQASTVSIGQLLIQSLVNTMNSDIVAGYGAAYKLSYVIINIFVTISNAISTFTSQNAGAKEFGRIDKGFIAGLLICICLTIFTTILFFSLSEPLLSIFEKTSFNKEVTKIGKTFIYILTPFFFTMCIKIPCDGVLKGSKDMRSFMIGTLLDLVIRVAFSYILVKPYGIKGIFWSWPIGWGIGMLSSMLWYKVGRWKKIIGYPPKIVNQSPTLKLKKS